MSLANLVGLRAEMESKDWSLCSFIFKYKGVEYIVLVKRFVGNEKKKSKYALVRLYFMKSDNLNDGLEIEANSKNLLVDIKILRQYFEIEYVDNLGSIIKQFKAQLGVAFPKTISASISQIERKAMVYSLSKSDSEDSGKIYCNKVKRNPKGAKRSVFNSDKTKLLRPSLFKLFCNEPNISFCYYADPTMENTDEVIMRNFSKYGFIEW